MIINGIFIGIIDAINISSINIIIDYFQDRYNPSRNYGNRSYC